ncbi:dephospho-CoA kinase [Silvimonas sp.]|uniref:dephospho-CoA kinase n=1 Tax=Silvimonas sp. TaxID=2650811 RepID=UPI0028461444|nr:dephospho-CoA kinase [Silvimonas sp.]MDR3427151.1 dephospho-CoA kinase [Silvimonas sp.]
MLVIGLTGGAGSGKSTVADLFAEHGAGIVDTDVIAHQLSRPPSAALDEIRTVFGDKFIAQDGSMDRPRMRELVLSDVSARGRLEAVFHPRILQLAKEQLQTLTATHHYALVVVPLLFESGRFLPLVSRTVTVDCTVERQRTRLAQRAGLTTQAIDQLLAAQFSREQRLALADEVIRNDGSHEELADQVATLHRTFIKLTKSA